jgi:hypothetical protein
MTSPIDAAKRRPTDLYAEVLREEKRLERMRLPDYPEHHRHGLAHSRKAPVQWPGPSLGLPSGVRYPVTHLK